jgi:hypothetical protein
MYGLPEMNFFVTDTLGELIDHFESRRTRYRLHGTVRVLAELASGEQTEATAEDAWQWLYGHRSMSMRDFARSVAEQVWPRQMVEKSPSNAASLRNLERMHRAFPEALYLHLTRHPRATGKSLFKVHDDRRQRKGRRTGRENEPLEAHRIESHWQEVQTNILKFTSRLPPGQCMTLQGEMFLADPDNFLRQLCEWLEIDDALDAIEAMKHPEESPYARPGPPNALSGNNPGFLKDPTLRVGKVSAQDLDSPLEWLDGRKKFDPYTVELARLLGYC